MGWLKKSHSQDYDDSIHSTSHLGILSLEAGKTMSKLVSLYQFLSDDQIGDFKSRVVKSRGVAYLNSMDESFVLTLACAETLEDLDKSAAVVARLGKNCSDFVLKRFDSVYADLKSGSINFVKMGYKSRDVEKKIEKMKRLMYSTQGLYNSLEGLAEMENSERKMKIWMKKNDATTLHTYSSSFDTFNRKISVQRKQVHLFKEASLWNKSFDESVRIMARVTCIIYARICEVFGPYIPVLPAPTANSLRRVRFLRQTDLGRVYPELSIAGPDKEQMGSKSGPLPVTNGKTSLVRFYTTRKSIMFVAGDENHLMKNNRAFHAAGPETLGGCGLASRYAELIILAEKYLDKSNPIGNDDREDMYEMLPESLKMAVRRKLGGRLRRQRDEEESDGEFLAEGWREGVRGIMEWLLPVAKDTESWMTGKNMESKDSMEVKPSVLLVQTLHFADKEKTEAAIVEVLVGLSCIYRYENRLYH